MTASTFKYIWTFDVRCDTPVIPEAPETTVTMIAHANSITNAINKITNYVSGLDAQIAKIDARDLTNQFAREAAADLHSAYKHELNLVVNVVVGYQVDEQRATNFYRSDEISSDLSLTLSCFDPTVEPSNPQKINNYVAIY